MTKANDLASLLDANGDVVSSALDNVPPSNDASALSTGTLAAARLPADIVVSDASPELSADLATNSNNINFGTNAKSAYGTSAQLMMYHDGSNGWIKGNNTGNNSIAIQSGGTGSVMISGSSGQNIISQQGDSAYLHHAGFAKLITTATGVDVTGGLNTTGNVGIGGSPATNLHIQQTATAGNNYKQGSVKIGSTYGVEIGYNGIGSGRASFTSLNNGGSTNNLMSFGFGAITSGGEPTNNVMTLNQSGIVGIGTSAPSGAKLEIFTGSTSTDGLKINRFGSGVYYSTLRQDSHGLAIRVGDGSTIAERVAITPNGITFNGDTAAANALDDYEEGTWTVQERHGQATITTNRANYTKIGSLVYASASVNISSTNPNNLNLTLPFASSITNYYAGNGSAGYHNLNSTYADNLRPVIENGADNVMFYYGTGSLVPCDGASGTRIDFTVLYMV